MNNVNDQTAARRLALEDALDQAGQLALTLFDALPDRTISHKSPQDLVSDADQDVEQLIKAVLTSAFPTDVVVGEEFGGEDCVSYWIVDPIDGTSNFLSGLPLWGVSIAYVVDGIPVLGGISVPALGYVAVGGPDQRIISAGLRARRDLGPRPAYGLGRNELWEDQKRQAHERCIDRAGHMPVTFGSCAVSMLFVAMGRLAGYREDNIAFWDCAAGIALCEAADIPVHFEFRTLESVDICIGNLSQPNDLAEAQHL